jgi:putative hemolysin
VGDIGPAEAVRRDDNSWLLDGLLPMDEVQDVLAIKTFPEDQGAYQTLGGLMMTMLGRIPVASDSFEWDGWRFEVVDMDGRRVDKVLVQRSENTVESPPGDDV